MKFLSITGPKSDIDRVAASYLSKYEMQLENTLSELKTVHDLRPYVEINPYKNLLLKANDYISIIDNDGVNTAAFVTLEEAVDEIKRLDLTVNDLKQNRQRLEEIKVKYLDLLHKISPYRELNYDVDSILQFKFIKYRFGKISIEYFAKLEKYVYENLDTIFYKCHSDSSYVWGVYFLPASQEDKIDAVYSSMHFERLFLPAEYDGTPEQAYQQLEEQINGVDNEIATINASIAKEINSSLPILLTARNKLDSLSRNFDVRKLAACTKNDNPVFYIICGWMAEEDAESFQIDIAEDENIFCIVEDDHNNIFSTPPTKLNNPKIFKPFEMFLKMYGLPAYDEFDPTIFVALTYTFIFGCMFGDAGQGIILVIGGALLYKIKKMDIAAIVSLAGVFSTIFGVLYGSVFGFEDIISAVWLKPMKTYITLPIIGTINSVLVLAVAFGMGTILISMIINIFNGIKQKNIEKIFFDTNGVAGLVFYGSIVASVVLIMSGHSLPGGIILLIMFGIPLIIIALKEPLTALVEKKADAMPKEIGMFILQTFFELFEIVLSYMTNTISFVRIGAFALSHAGMMEVVLLLSGAENGGTPNWLIFIIGNLIVMGMEGLIVGIHVLRLEYYEMFSRFFSGSGRAFSPYSKQKD